MANLILGSEIFTNIILPFLFIFTVVFAILDKTKFLGEKRDVNAIVALVFGLVAIGVPWAMNVVLNIIPVVVIIIVILISWLMTYGFMGGYDPKTGISPAWKIAFQIILGIAFIGTVAWATGVYKLVLNSEWANKAGETILLIGAVIAVISIVVSGGQKAKPE